MGLYRGYFIAIHLLLIFSMRHVPTYADASRRDKYEKDVWEFWVDVETTGSVTQSCEEEFLQSFEIVDADVEVPAPTIGSSPMPIKDGKWAGDGESGDEGQEDDEEEDEDEKTPMKNSLKKRSPKSKLTRKPSKSKDDRPSKAARTKKTAEDEAEEAEVQECLEDTLSIFVMFHFPSQHNSKCL